MITAEETSPEPEGAWWRGGAREAAGRPAGTLLHALSQQR